MNKHWWQPEVITKVQAEQQEDWKNTIWIINEWIKTEVSNITESKLAIKPWERIHWTDYIVKEVWNKVVIWGKDFYRTKIEDTKTTYVFIDKNLEILKTVEWDVIKRIWDRINFWWKNLLDVSLMDNRSVAIDEDTFCVAKTINGDIIKWTWLIHVIWEKSFFNTQLENKKYVVINEEFEIAKTSDGKIIREVRKKYLLWGKEIYNVRIDKDEDIFVDENFEIIKTSDGMIPREINSISWTTETYRVRCDNNKEFIVMHGLFERI